MRLSKIFTIVALSALTLPVLAQTITRIAGYDTSLPNWWNQTYDDIAGRVYNPVLPSIRVPLYLDIIPDQTWVRGAPSPGKWATWAVTFFYNPRYIDFVVFNDAGAEVLLSSIATTNENAPGDPGPFLRTNVDPNNTFIEEGIASGGVLRLPDGRIRLTLVVAATSNANGDQANESGAGFGYAKSPLRRAHGPNIPGVPAAAAWARRLIFLELKPSLIASEMGGVLELPLSVQSQQFINKIGPGPSEGRFGGPYQFQARFLVPEPASMIALGSGLVGLLALRRRKK